jgi:hypothetical protein
LYKDEAEVQAGTNNGITKAKTRLDRRRVQSGGGGSFLVLPSVDSSVHQCPSISIHQTDIMTTPMEIDAGILTTDVPEIQPPGSPPHDADPTAINAPPKKKGRRPGAVGDAATAPKKKKDEERLPGTTTLPVARVKRILGADEELQNIGREAVFLLSVATVRLFSLSFIPSSPFP